MSFIYKAFTVVMLVTLISFIVAKPVFARFMSAGDFARRRNLWLWLCATSFLSPSIWLFVLLAAPAIFFASRKDPNPVAMYLFILLAVPPVRVAIPTFGLVGQVFPMDYLRLLSLALLLPLAVRLVRQPRQEVSGAVSVRSALSVVDVLLLSFLGLQVVLSFPYDSATNMIRRILLMLIDIVLPYFVVSRACRGRAMIAEAMAGLVIGVAVLAPFCVFEFFKGWMLFAGIETQWAQGEPGRLFFPLYRGPFLRAQTTAGHSIFMGYFMAMAFGMWLYLQGRIDARGWRWLGLLALMAGLVTALARGPWVGAVAVLITYLVLGPDATRRAFKGIVLMAVVCAVVIVSPWRDQVIDYLPFVGTVDSQTVIARQELAAGSWLLIQQNPYFGSPSFLAYMEQFRTGEGIIDLVNTYAVVALSFGLVGMVLFVGVFLASIWRAFSVVRRLSASDPDAAQLGVALIACLVGTLVVIATTSFLHAMPYMVYAMAGLTFAYVRSAADQPSRSPAALASVLPVRRAYE